MRWISNKRHRETSTGDGYRLVIKYIDESNYAWIVFYKGKRINLFTNKPMYKPTIAQAKRQAVRLMIHHMQKKVD